MPKALPQLELMRSETFPFPQRFALGVSPLGILSYFDTAPRLQDEASMPPATAPSTPTIVLLHALGTNYTAWEYVAPELAERTRVIGLDMPGCGHSVRPAGPYRMADIRDAAWALLDHLGVVRPLLVGHSFGGRLVMEMALARPGQAAGLVLLNSAGLIRYPHFFGTVGKQLLTPKVVGTLIMALAPLFVGRIFGQPSPRSRRFLRQVLGRVDLSVPYDFANHFVPLLPDLVSDVLDRLPELKLPVQVIWGDKDALLAMERVEPAFAELARFTHVAIERLVGCGHMPNLERPEVVTATILRFVSQLSR